MSGDSITGNGGAMNITGTGGNSSGNFNYGIYVHNASVTNSSSGTITLNAPAAAIPTAVAIMA